MDEEIERLVVSVRADTQGFASDVAAMREELDGPLGDSIGRAGALIENALSRAVRTGKLGFEDLRQVAARAMAEIARSAVSGGIGNLSGGSTGGDLVSRSEEHTSELQSLMRISYAVFCLNKKKQTTTQKSRTYMTKIKSNSETHI